MFVIFHLLYLFWPDALCNPQCVLTLSPRSGRCNPGSRKQSFLFRFFKEWCSGDIRHTHTYTHTLDESALHPLRCITKYALSSRTITPLCVWHIGSQFSSPSFIVTTALPLFSGQPPLLLWPLLCSGDLGPSVRCRWADRRLLPPCPPPPNVNKHHPSIRPYRRCCWLTSGLVPGSPWARRQTLPFECVLMAHLSVFSAHVFDTHCVEVEFRRLARLSGGFLGQVSLHVALRPLWQCYL